MTSPLLQSILATLLLLFALSWAGLYFFTHKSDTKTLKAVKASQPVPADRRTRRRMLREAEKAAAKRRAQHHRSIRQRQNDLAPNPKKGIAL